MQQNRGRGRGGRGRGGRGRGRGRGGGSNASTRAAESNNGNRGSSNNGGDAAVRSYNNNNGPNNSNPNQYVAGANKRPAANRENRKAMRRERQQQAINAKTAGEDSHFWKCVQATNGRVKGPSEKVTESELFSAHTGVRGIDFGKYSDIKVDVSDPTINPATTFASLQSLVGSELSKNIKLMHYETPTPIQRFGLPAGLASRDLMCCAQTGSGKTCCFLVPMIRKLQLINNSQSGGTNNNNNNGRRGCYPQGLVLAPTRELALQIEEESRKLCYGTDVVPVCVYGGAPSRSQLSSLASTRNRKQIVVATPGRLVDFTSRGLINLSSVQVLTLDEADRMLDMGFEPQVRRIVEKFGMPPSESRLTLLFSATFPSSIQKLASDFLRKDYVWIAVGRVGSTTASIEQRILKTTKDRPAKLELLSTQLGAVEGRTLVFVQRKRTASQVRKALQRQYGISSDEIHGDRSQSQREAALERFRAGESRVLVATNVAARGLDIAGVSHVINFDLPVAAADFDDYVHRVGRTGRAGHRGTATSFYVPGYEAKHGNGPIAKLILKKLVDEKQEIPQWFATLPEVGNGGGNKGQQPQHQRPATDHRQKNRDTKIPRVVDNSNPGSGRGRGRGGRGRGGRRPNTTRN